MRSIILSLFSLSVAVSAYAQSGIFAITADKAGAISWNKVRAADGKPTLPFYDATEVTFYINARSKERTLPQLRGIGPDDASKWAGLAALAFDAANNRIYFAPLFRQGGIRYIDLNYAGAQKPVILLEDNYKALDRATDGEGKNLTRMTIGKNGMGYAITNDGAGFYRFDTRQNGPVENLGTLIDDEKNGSVSVHHSCSAWGGDIVAAATGDLYLFTMRQQVFKINPNNRIATYLGNIKGPDANFLVNGAAVDENGFVVLASSIEAGKKWVIEDMLSLEATLVDDPNWLNASDLASGHLLFATRKSDASPFVTPAAMVSDIAVYPNPVFDGQLMLVFSGKETGRFQIDLLNASGVGTVSKTIQVLQRGHTEKIGVRSMAKGWYVLRVTNATKGSTYAEKVLLQ